ncbi:MAG: hypothetical protein Greene041662_203 [Candidatus Peregrinibacteria bacterium Greene0416_62]|nr:MAG: hypothetical protein Greene041662_203 [Candidatus Peregrinibacteria bacterium Greene0416_62]
MGIVVATTEEGIAIVSTRSRQRHAGIVHTCEMRDAIGIVSTFIGASTINRETLRIVACKMRVPSSTAKGRITIILAVTRDSDALIVLAFRMLTACNFL